MLQVLLLIIQTLVLIENMLCKPIIYRILCNNVIFKLQNIDKKLYITLLILKNNNFNDIKHKSVALGIRHPKKLSCQPNPNHVNI